MVVIIATFALLVSGDGSLLPVSILCDHASFEYLPIGLIELHFYHFDRLESSQAQKHGPWGGSNRSGKRVVYPMRCSGVISRELGDEMCVQTK